MRTHQKCCEEIIKYTTGIGKIGSAFVSERGQSVDLLLGRGATLMNNPRVRDVVEFMRKVTE